MMTKTIKSILQKKHTDFVTSIEDERVTGSKCKIGVH
jgi:hypothetical protein